MPSLQGCNLAGLGVDALLTDCPQRSPSARLLITSDQGKTFYDTTLPDSIYRYSVERLSDELFLASRSCASVPAAFLIEPARARVKVLDETPCREYFGLVRDGAGGALGLGRSAQGLGVFAWKGGVSRSLGLVLADTEDLIEAKLATVAPAKILVVARTRHHGFVLARSFDEGRSFSFLTLPAAASALSLAGNRGLLLAADGTPSRACAPARHCVQAFETNDAGSTWHRVTFPHSAGAGGLECVSEGCLTAAGFRVGWELPAPASRRNVRSTDE
jgi:hypothetical protein